MNRSLLALLFVTLAAVVQCGLAAIGDRYAFERVPPSPRTCIQDGCLQGKYLDGFEGDQFEAYLGIPFAKPPLGKLRFKNPVQNDPWTGDYDATWERSRCLQKNDLRPLQTIQGGEDCLYLNVFRPKNITTPLPVIFNIHGGGYAYGASSIGEFGPERFMDTKKIILVVPQYRLGVFGFLSTEDRVAPGNFGMKDQAMALKWTRDNIGFLGGNPNLITLIGESVGGSSVQFHMMSPLSKGLFARAVSMSGSALSNWNYNVDHLALARRQAEVVGVKNPKSMTTEQLVDELRKVDALELAKSIDILKFFYVHPITLYHPTIERYVDQETFMSEDPRDLWAAGKYSPVPYTVGFLPNEGAYASAIILTNRSLLNDLNEHSSDYIPRLVGANHPTSVQMIKNRFFPDGSNERWLTENNLLSEGIIIHGIVLSVKQIISSKNSQKAPLSVYFFNFKGPYSRSYYNSYTYGDFGVCHADDLMYIFRASDFFPDFEPQSPAWHMAKVFVDYFVTIAYNGYGFRTAGPLCTAESCQLLEFTNSADEQKPVDLNLINGFDEDQFAFWYNVNALQSY
ncbi:gut esterase 1 [Culex quinquefasciatus]|uniref:carboxylesterase n=1 Tax=Culex quinquefasciatus TaxID=7176 RepID=B0W3Q8_CULQU|nr:gut esterase 1 [Culex quinquefasciatus]|eukprot:XP_001843342.1 gut esterase 1 [Culex quinquefasciatus]